MYGYNAERFEIISDLMEDVENWEIFERDLEKNNPWAE